MAEKVALAYEPLYTERWDIPYYEVPSLMPNCTYQDGKPGSKSREYGRVLDTVYEMADAVCTGNGVEIEAAIEQVLKDEGWNILPNHKRLLATIYKQPEGPFALGSFQPGYHSYSIGVQRAGRIFNIEVTARERKQAAAVARQQGYRVRDVNMVG